MADVLLNSLSVLFELLIYYFFFRYFFQKARFSKRTMIFVYLLAGIASLYVSMYAPSKFVHRMGYFVIVVLLALCYKGQLFIQLFVPFVFQAISIMVENCYALVLMPLKNSLKIYGNESFYFYYFIGIILSNLTILLLVRLFCTWKNYVFVKEKDIVFPLYFPLLFLFPVCVMFVIDQYSLAIARSGNIGFLTVIPVLFLVIITIAFFFLFDGLLHSVQTKQKMDVLQKKLEQEQEYYRILLRKHQQFQQLRHDMRDDFNYIAALIKSDAYVTALEYAKRKSGQLALTSVIQTGNPMLDAILTIKEEQARRIHANFQSYISAELNQSKMAIEDLSSLCSNVLNNALEAVEQIEDKAFRRIFFRLVQKGRFLYIVVQNATSNEITIEGDVLETTKQDKKMHGFGLSIVKNIVEKYDGGCHLEWEQYIFTIKIVLPVMEDEEQ